MAADTEIETLLAREFDPQRLKVAELRDLLAYFGVPHTTKLRKNELIELVLTELGPGTEQYRSIKKQYEREHGSKVYDTEQSNGGRGSSGPASMYLNEKTAPFKSKDRADQNPFLVHSSSRGDKVATKGATISEGRINGRLESTPCGHGTNEETQTDRHASRSSPLVSSPSLKTSRTIPKSPLSPFMKLQDSTSMKTKLVNSPLGRTLATADSGNIPSKVIRFEGERPDQKRIVFKSKIDGAFQSTAPKRGRLKRSSALASNLLLWTSLVILSISLLMSVLQYRQESLRLGYCDHDGKISQRLAGSRTWASWVSWCPPQLSSTFKKYWPQPTCTVCPRDAICEDGRIVRCSEGFTLVPNMWRRLLLWPLAYECQPDTQRMRNIVEIAGTVAELLRKYRGDVECKYIKTSHRYSDTDAVKWGQDSAQIREDLLATGLFSEALLDELWSFVMTELDGRSDIEVLPSANGGITIYATIADKDLFCRSNDILRSVLRTAWPWILTLFCLLAFARYSLASLRDRREISRRVPDLVRSVLTILQEQPTVETDNDDDDDGRGRSLCVSESKLRDALLSDEHSVSRRLRIWSKVSDSIESYANVRCLEGIEDGESCRAWEWIGGSKADLLSPKKGEHAVTTMRQ